MSKNEKCKVNINLRKDYLKKIYKLIKDKNMSKDIELGVLYFSKIYLKENNLENLTRETIYIDKIEDIISNLDPKSYLNNIGFRDRVIKRSINPYTLAFLKPEDVYPENWERLISRNKMLEDIIDNVETTDLYQCSKCKERKFKITEIQLRSADEPSSKIHTCMVCHNVFIK